MYRSAIIIEGTVNYEKFSPTLSIVRTDFKISSKEVQEITFFLNCASRFFDQSSADLTATETTAISTPLDKVPLYIVPIEEVPTTLLKSSHASSSSDLFNFGTPAMRVGVISTNKS